MTAGNEWHCWQITHCGCGEKCSTRQLERDARPCWEVAQELDDYRSALNVCKDCIVFISKHNRTALTEQEVHDILQRKVDCVLTTNCPCKEE